MDEIMTTAIAADFLHLKPAALLKLANAGEIPATKIGDDWRFVKSQLITFMATKASAEQNIRKSMQPELTQQQTEKTRQRQTARGKN
ncbi:helix-turn-helix domain-containing protein [Methylocucumis oryzae]|uniref:Helix-turn-helix domain-containing protein n=1 Tax=Methylocucumis oryzae TaxID=1632867 RepID=A0A0F3IMN4_9GAMM|nr:helix-turn-helix domain-containing protein [Methylocucumis oryzae]KJV08000.1 hypothetical protein VZ94_00855 [Methylocucumis oryzae]